MFKIATYPKFVIIQNFKLLKSICIVFFFHFYIISSLKYLKLKPALAHKC